jgi:hypothetical protein
MLFVAGISALAIQVRLPEGQDVRLSLRDVLTTENAVKDASIDFDVAEDVVVNGHVVIAKGAPARGKVVRVKGAGNKKAKDASVTFEFVSVRSVDNQVIPLRKMPYKGKKKGEAKENEIEESSQIPGYAERVIGAEKGKMYLAFIDSASFVVNVADTAPAAVTTPAPAAPPVQVTQPAVTTPPTPPPSPLAVEAEPAAVDFDSSPTGAEIYIDGTLVGTTPASPRVPPGRHTIEFRLRGYRSWTQAMVVVSGSHPTVRKTLEKE